MAEKLRNARYQGGNRSVVFNPLDQRDDSRPGEMRSHAAGGTAITRFRRPAPRALHHSLKRHSGFSGPGPHLAPQQGSSDVWRQTTGDTLKAPIAFLVDGVDA